MKPKNFPGRKLARQLIAKGEDINSAKNAKLTKLIEQVRTKKNRR